ncbi:MAG: shikimate kinase [Acidimicrobiia bacterium]|nr:shikimate kinase [Acidimicrobiia bacterium]
MTARGVAPGSHLFLVGMMGAGKTTVGRLCAAELGRPFVDLDARVEARAGRPVAEIFAHDGEAAFRRLEGEALAEVAASPVAAVVACGGGVVLDPAHRARLRTAGLVVWLDAPAGVLAERLGAGEGRPLLESAPGGVEPALARLARAREAAYREAAHAVVDASPPDPAVVAAAVAAAVREAERPGATDGGGGPGGPGGPGGAGGDAEPAHRRPATRP